MTRKIFHVSFPFLFWPTPFQWHLVYQQPKLIPVFEKVKVFPELCVPQNVEIYMLSPIYLLNLIFCICMRLPFYKLWLSLRFKKNTSGKYITPHILSCSKPFSKIQRWSWDSFKHHLVIIKCDHFYKIALLIM